MIKQPEFRKYLPLEAWFRNQATTVEQIELTFDVRHVQNIDHALTPQPAELVRERTQLSR